MTDLVIDSITEDDERIIINVSTREPKILIDIGRTFTRSNGTVVARLYERLTKRSRRKQTSSPFVPGGTLVSDIETAYRKGVFDAYKNLQEELNYLI